MCYTCSRAAAVLEATNHCVSTPQSDSIASSVCAPQGDVEPEPSRGAKRSAAVRRLGTPGSATGKNCNFHHVPGLISAF